MSEHINAKIHKFLGRGDDWHELDGWTIAGEYLNCHHCGVTFMEHYDNNPRYLDDGNAMLDLLAELRKREYQVCIDFDNTVTGIGYNVDIESLNQSKLYEASADTLPLALALAVEKVIDAG